MPIERTKIRKPYLILCEGKDAELFLINYLESDALADDKRFSNDIQIFDFGGNSDLLDYLMNLKNMDGFDKVGSLAIIRDAETDFAKAEQEVKYSLNKCGISPPEHSGNWSQDPAGLMVGYILFPLSNEAGTLEDLCLRIIAEKDNKEIISSVDAFLDTMESSFNRHYRQKHKNRLYTYLASSDKYFKMQIGLASKAGAFDWNSNAIKPLKSFLTDGFTK